MTDYDEDIILERIEKETNKNIARDLRIKCLELAITHWDDYTGQITDVLKLALAFEKMILKEDLNLA